MSAPTPPHDPGDPGDPIREARGRALGEFLEPGPLPESARQAEAEAHLLAELERELGVTIGPSTRVPAREAADRSPGGFGRLFAWLFAAPLRPAFAAAVLVVAVAGAWLTLRPAGDTPVLRGPVAGDPASGWNAAPSTTTIGDERVRLAWRPAAGASHYAVVFLAGDLTEVARVDSLPSTEIVLESAAPLPGLTGHASGDALLWRVSAYSGPDEIARSHTSPVTLP